MKKYIGKRIMISLVTLLIIILVLFMLLQLMPGSPFNDEKLTADQIAMMSKKYGLDKPLIVQFFTYVKNLLQGDFGVSYVISKDTSISVLPDPQQWLLLPYHPLSCLTTKLKSW